jgi:hypothetical protein
MNCQRETNRSKRVTSQYFDFFQINEFEQKAKKIFFPKFVCERKSVKTGTKRQSEASTASDRTCESTAPKVTIWEVEGTWCGCVSTGSCGAINLFQSSCNAKKASAKQYKRTSRKGEKECEKGTRTRNVLLGRFVGRSLRKRATGSRSTVKATVWQPQSDVLFGISGWNGGLIVRVKVSYLCCCE